MLFTDFDTDFTADFDLARLRMRELVECVDEVAPLMAEDDVIANERILSRMRTRHINLLTLRRSLKTVASQARVSLDGRDEVVAASREELRGSITFFIDTVEEHLSYFRTFIKTRKGKRSAKPNSRTSRTSYH